MDKKKIIITASIIGTAIVLTTIYFSRRKRKKLEDKIAKGNTDVINASKSTDSSVIFPLKRGSGYSDIAENNAVVVAQRWLNVKIAENSYIGYALLDEDGLFGLKTENALRRISGTSTVSYSFYKQMLLDLTSDYLTGNTGNIEKKPETGIFDYLNL